MTDKYTPELRVADLKIDVYSTTPGSKLPLAARIYQEHKCQYGDTHDTTRATFEADSWAEMAHLVFDEMKRLAAEELERVQRLSLVLHPYQPVAPAPAPKPYWGPYWSVAQ